ncbi:twin-arginine translocation pathway signal protein [Massilia sp. WF1]|uniref:nucleoside hydrolase n=1 Tax=unclassified Massilia TaxID=2609279 RepID=UPI000649CBBA|nr:MULTISPECIES: nucleoside hydrolase [unclassified Massilia]ALK95463.1 twin-arginine translocation pathway signal protein [Massilia sp. WG5]KLU34959.1 twin-arginine translocation pathway signal protein [Massilia sp. WF1]
MQQTYKSGRRAFCAGLTAALGSLALGPALAAAPRKIPQRASARVIVDNDFGGDPDGLAALAHQLLSPKTRVPLITVSALDPKFAGDAGKGQTVRAGVELAQELLGRIGLESRPAIAAGAEDFSPGPSDAARAIVAEALRDDPLPLIVTCGGPLTNIAAALRLEPAIAKKMTVIWIGGGAFPAGGWEYNLMTDIEAARLVIEGSRVPLWVVPQAAYRQMQYSIAEMDVDMRPISPLTEWLYDRFTTPPDWIDIGGAWPLGDSPLVLLSAISAESSRYRELPARRILRDGRYGAAMPGRSIRVYEQLDARLTFGDFLALLKRQAAGSGGVVR